VHLGVGVQELDVPGAKPRRPLAPPRQHLGRDVNPGNLAAGPDPSRQLQRRPSRSAAQIDHPLAGEQLQAIHSQLARGPAHLLQLIFQLKPRRRQLRPELGLLDVGESRIPPVHENSMPGPPPGPEPTRCPGARRTPM